MLIILIYILLSVLLGVILLSHLKHRHIVAAVLYPIFLVLLFATFIETRGSPRNFSYEWKNISRNTVLGGYLDEPNAIYVWLLPAGETVPIYYVIEWNLSAADQVQTMLQKTSKGNTKIELDIDALNRQLRAGEGVKSTQIYREHSNKSLPPKTPTVELPHVPYFHPGATDPSPLGPLGTTP